MARKLTNSVIAKIQARKREGLTHEQLAAEFGLSLGSISAAVRSVLPSAKKPERATVDDGPPAPAPSSPAVEEGAEVGLEDIRRMLGQMARTLRDVGEEARQKGDRGVYLQFVRASTAAFKEIGRFTPAKPPDENDDPDMIAAAKTAREKILERIRRSASKGAHK